MVVNNNSIHPQLPKFIGKNFDNWCIQMRILFRSQDLWNLVNIDCNKVTDSKESEALSREQKDSLKDFRKKDKKTLFCNIPSSGWIHIWENLRGRNNKRVVGYFTEIIQRW